MALGQWNGRRGHLASATDKLLLDWDRDSSLYEQFVWLMKAKASLDDGVAFLEERKRHLHWLGSHLTTPQLLPAEDWPFCYGGLVSWTHSPKARSLTTCLECQGSGENSGGQICQADSSEPSSRSASLCLWGKLITTGPKIAFPSTQHSASYIVSM